MTIEKLANKETNSCCIAVVYASVSSYMELVWSSSVGVPRIDSFARCIRSSMAAIKVCTLGMYLMSMILGPIKALIRTILIHTYAAPARCKVTHSTKQRKKGDCSPNSSISFREQKPSLQSTTVHESWIGCRAPFANTGMLQTLALKLTILAKASSNHWWKINNIEGKTCTARIIRNHTH